MQSLSEGLRQTICDHIRASDHDELFRIARAITAEDVAIPEAPVLISTSSCPPRTIVASRFECKDVVVVDRVYGLMWSRADVTEKPVAWAAADKACRDLRLGGFSDWRLPTVDELFALADRTKHDPAIDKTAFPSCRSAWYWTSTPYAAPSPGDCAWYVFFNSGGAYWDYRDGGYYVRAVRPSQ